MAPDSVVGIERVDLNTLRPAGHGSPQSLGVLCQQGEVTLDVGGKQRR